MVNATVTALIRNEPVDMTRDEGPPRLGISAVRSEELPDGFRGVVISEVLDGTGAAAAALCSFSSSPSFQALRCHCQAPRLTRTASPASINKVGQIKPAWRSLPIMVRETSLPACLPRHDA